MANNKVQLSSGAIIIDLTSDTVTSASHIKKGFVGHLADGTTATGTLVEKDVKNISYNLSGGVTASLETSEVVTGQGYSVKLKAPAGYELSNVAITMDGVDITSQVFRGESGGAEPVLDSKTITENGTYTASDDDLDGYSDVSVNVPSPWKLISSTELEVSTTSTSAGTAGTIQCGSEIATANKIVWVHIRDTAGPRAGYFYGSDSYFVNVYKANGATTAFTAPACELIRYNNGAYAATSGQYGVWGYSISNAGALTIRRRYNSSYTLTIDGTYKIDVYTLDLPDGVSLFG